jgi:hypothetical protein
VVEAYVYKKDFDPFVSTSICITVMIQHYRFVIVKDDQLKGPPPPALLLMPCSSSAAAMTKMYAEQGCDGCKPLKLWLRLW